MTDPVYGPNPVIAAFDAGHLAVAGTGRLKDREVCRECGVEWPCGPIVVARREASVRGDRMAADLKNKPVPGRAQGLLSWGGR